VFRVSGYIDLADGAPGMLIPAFAKDGTNTPYVQSMDEFYDIEDFFAYYQYENYSFVSEGLLIEAEIGGAGLIALNWSRLSEQKFRVDKWSFCRG
jgi:hypothetical protein